MGIAERRQREREELQAAIIDAAVAIVSEQGIDALSVRAVADRIEYSHATIYLYFKGKDELLRAVVHAGFDRFDGMLMRALEESEGAGTQGALAAVRRAYIDFALEHTAYFRLMFNIPGVPCMEPDCRPSDLGVMGEPLPRRDTWNRFGEIIARGIAAGELPWRDPEQGTIAFWAILHGYVSLYLAGHLDRNVHGADELEAMIAAAMPGGLPRALPR